MESKLSRYFVQRVGYQTFNRTSMESKPPFYLGEWSAQNLLIEPVWNRNKQGSHQRDTGAYGTFNRTSMESKLAFLLGYVFRAGFPFNRTSMESKQVSPSLR